MTEAVVHTTLAPSDDSLVALVQVVSLISSVAFYLTGSTTCIKIHRQKSAKNVNFLPYLMTSLNCFLWLVYGTLKNDRLVYSVNSIGCVLQFIYIFVFIQNCETKGYYVKRIFAAICFDLMVVSFAYLGNEEFDVLRILGYTACAVTVLMFGSPLSSLREVIKTESTETISVPLTISTLIVSGAWFYYGYLIHDSFVQLPNCLGFILGVIQLLLVLIYRTPKKTSIMHA